MDDGKFSFRWGVELFDNARTDIPNVILENYCRVPWEIKNHVTGEVLESGTGITNTEMMFIIHLASFKYESPNGKAAPSLTGSLRKRMGYKSNQGIINIVQGLVEKGLLIINKRHGARSEYDFTPFSQAIIEAQNPSTFVDELNPSTKVDQSSFVDDHSSSFVDDTSQVLLTQRREEEEKNNKLPGKKRSSSTGGKTPSVNQLMFGAIASACKIELSVITKETRGLLNQTERIMREAKATPDDIEAHSQWWYLHDWRGQKGQPPTPSQIRETWGQFMSYRSAGTNGTGKGRVSYK